MTIKTPLIAIVQSWGLHAVTSMTNVETIDVDNMYDARSAMSMIDGVILTGGGDVNPKRYANSKHEDVYGIDRERDELEFYIVEQARIRNVPIMGICRGSQILNIAYGGSLYQDISDLQQVAHWGAMQVVKMQPKTEVARAIRYPSFKASHYHHQAIDRVGQGLWPAAWSEDGIIEAIESLPGAKPYVLGTQFHPEMDYPAKEASAIFTHFVRKCIERASRRRLTAKERVERYTGNDDDDDTMDVNVMKNDDSWSDSWTPEGGWESHYVSMDAASQMLENDWVTLSNLDNETYYETYPSGYMLGEACDKMCAFPPCRDPFACNPIQGDCLAEAIANTHDVRKRGSKR